MSDKGLFDLEIKILQKELRYWPSWKERVESSEAVIRILEALGKVDKVELKYFIHLYLDDLDPNPILEFMETVYRALPDKEEN